VCAAGLVVVGPRASAAALTGAAWSASKTTDGATGATYTYTFTAATSAALDAITMTVPTGTGGTLSVGAVSPAAITGGTVSLAGTTLTYSFTSAAIIANEAISVQVNGITNTGTAGSDTSTITTDSTSGAVDTGTTGTVTFTAAALTTPGWSASSTTVGATGTSYTYTFSTTGLISAVTMTVPPGTTGTPTVGTVSPAALTGGTVTLSGTTLTYSGTFLSLGLLGTAVSIQIGGLTNTNVAGAYSSEIVTESLGVAVDSGVAAAVSLTGPLSVTAPGSLTWAITLNGVNQDIADAVAGDQQVAVSDETLTGAGWDVTISATTFTNGTHTLPDTGTFVLTGAVSSITASGAPSLACTLSCIPPADPVTYPVAVTTAASSPSPVSVYEASAASGLGGILLGGSSAADPFGWWVKVPGNAWRGAYTSTVTVAIASGP
jgi:hypothetical protein